MKNKIAIPLGLVVFIGAIIFSSISTYLTAGENKKDIVKLELTDKELEEQDQKEEKERIDKDYQIALMLKDMQMEQKVIQINNQMVQKSNGIILEAVKELKEEVEELRES